MLKLAFALPIQPLFRRLPAPISTYCTVPLSVSCALLKISSFTAFSQPQVQLASPLIQEFTSTLLSSGSG